MAQLIMKRTVLTDRAKLQMIAALLVLVCFASFFVGRYPVEPDAVLGIMAAKLFWLPHAWSGDMETVVMTVRLPRILAALLVGAALSASGAAYQGMFRNPMVSPGILGVSAGASFGAALAILLSLDFIWIQFAAFGFGLAAVAVTYLASTKLSKSRDTMLVLILAGIIVGTVFTSFVSLIKFLADPLDKLPTITFWLMGGLSTVNLSDIGMIVIPIMAGLIVLILLRWKLNVMSFGDEEAQALGVNTGRLRCVVIFCATLITASAVSVSGIIGLVGLIVPHLTRLVVGPNYKVLLPASVMMGAIFLLVVDNFSRILWSVEIPLGILTSIIGAPIFMYLLLTSQRGWTS
ncbi:MAG: putative transporter permease protein [Firmicutes bacterium]|nr:putative transporter permease protein [Bacillota bacterium]